MSTPATNSLQKGSNSPVKNPEPGRYARLRSYLVRVVNRQPGNGWCKAFAKMVAKTAGIFLAFVLAIPSLGVSLYLFYDFTREETRQQLAGKAAKEQSPLEIEQLEQQRQRLAELEAESNKAKQAKDELDALKKQSSEKPQAAHNPLEGSHEAALTKQITDLESKLRELTDNQQNLAGDITTKEQLLAEAQQNLESEQQQRARYAGQIQALENQLSTLANQKTTLEQHVEKLQQLEIPSTAEVATATDDGKQQNLSTDLIEAQNTILELENQKRATQKTLSNYEQQFALSNRRIETLEQAVTESEQLRQEIAELKAERDRFEGLGETVTAEFERQIALLERSYRGLLAGFEHFINRVSEKEQRFKQRLKGQDLTQSFIGDMNILTESVLEPFQQNLDILGQGVSSAKEQVAQNTDLLSKSSKGAPSPLTSPNSTRSVQNQKQPAAALEPVPTSGIQASQNMLTQSMLGNKLNSLRPAPEVEPYQRPLTPREELLAKIREQQQDIDFRSLRKVKRAQDMTPGELEVMIQNREFTTLSVSDLFFLVGNKSPLSAEQKSAITQHNRSQGGELNNDGNFLRDAIAKRGQDMLGKINATTQSLSEIKSEDSEEETDGGYWSD